MVKHLTLCAGLLLGLMLGTYAQDDSTYVEEEIDWSQYDFADEGAKRFCSNKIIGLSPSQFISLGYDFQGPYQMSFSDISETGYQPGDELSRETANVQATHGVRLGANVPVYSRNSIVIQLGASFWDMRYAFEDPESLQNPVAQSLRDNGLRTAGLNTTIFKPLNEKNFLVLQAQADLNGDYALDEWQSLRYLRYSAALLYGWRTSDYLQWGVGLSRTYRVGELNYIPIVMFNWTSRSSNWGTEILFPARAHVRYTFNARSMAFFGYELEGQSYRLNTISEERFNDDQSLEIRRGEMRWRFMWQRQLVGFIWLQVQAGWRYNWSYDADLLPEGREFFRGFFGDQPFAMLNQVGNPFYANVSINLVSP
jgi:hypothetical protein